MPGEIIPSREFYDYEAKYLDEGSKVIIPADLKPRTAAEIRRLSIEAFQAIDGAGMARVDFLLVARHQRDLRQRSEHDPRVHDDQHVRQALGRRPGVDYPALLDRLIALALERHAEKQQLRTSLT